MVAESRKQKEERRRKKKEEERRKKSEECGATRIARVRYLRYRYLL